jgi:CopG family nickel-responsive transcriptional regulator
MTVRRFGVSLDTEVMEMLDSYVQSNQFPNRSQAIRHLIEQHTVEKKWMCNNEVAGAIVIVYNHHKNDITKQANEIQHTYHHLILSSQHIHLDHDLCLETIAVRGQANDLTDLADKLIALKGVNHGRLVMSRT